MKPKAPRKTAQKATKKPAAKAKKARAITPEVLPVGKKGPSRFQDEEEDFLERPEGPETSEDEIEEEVEAKIDEEARALVPRAPSLPSVQQEIETQLVAVSPTDPLRRYMEEIRRYPLLSPEEEFALALKMHEQGDMNAAQMLGSANLRLVVKIAMEYRSFYSNLLDLIQEGNIGLMKAVSKFDPTKGARVGYYASWWIRSYILKYLLDNFRLVKIGTTQAQKKLFYHLMREKERLEAQGLLAGPRLLAEKLNVREKDVVEMEQRLSGRGAELSLDTPISNEDGAISHIDSLADESEAADEALARDELLKLLKGKLPEFEKQLGEKELRILKERLLSEEPKTLQEVADLYGLTRERARQIENRVIEKLREFLSADL